jgi:hypothetical protein
MIETLVQNLANAIAEEEGFYINGSVPQRARNPGDLTDAGDVGCGVIETSGPMGAHITIYPTVEAGWGDLTRKLTRILNGGSHVYTLDMTFMEMGMKWAGVVSWGVNVAAKLGVDPRMTLAEYISQSATDVVETSA